MAQVTTDMPSSQQQNHHSSDNNNGNDRSLPPTGVGSQEKSVPITALLEMWASMLGGLVCGWVVLLLVQGGIMPTVETEDRVFITVLFFLVYFRCWRYFYPYDTGTLSEATQSLPADDNQQLGLGIGFISGLFYWWNLFSAMTCVVLSSMRLVSQDFGQTDEVAKKVARDFNLNVFYGLTLVEALVLFLALTFVEIMAMLRKLIEWMTHSQPAPPTLSQPALELVEAQMGRAEMAEAQLARAQMNGKQMGEAQMPEKEIRQRRSATKYEHGDPEGEAPVSKDL